MPRKKVHDKKPRKDVGNYQQMNAPANNTSGELNIAYTYWQGAHEGRYRWRVTLMVGGKMKGVYRESLWDAVIAREEMREKYWPGYVESKKAHPNANLQGRVFGQLLVTHQVDSYVSPKGQKRRMWHCLWKCGRQVDIAGYLLTTGRKTSCGHDAHTQNLVGKQFSHWTVVRDDGTRGAGNAIKWLCRCDCGNYGHVSTAALNSGQSKSCGHVNKQFLNEFREQRMKETPGTNLSQLNDHLPVTNKTGLRNISITYRSGQKYYRVAIQYKGKQHSHIYRTLERAIEAREALRAEYWPNYEPKTVEEVLKDKK